jgi:serine/threonine protein kinase
MLCHTREQLDDAQREIKVLRSVRHASILPLLGDTSLPSSKVRGATDVFLLFPFCNGGSIFSAIFNSPDTTPQYVNYNPSTVVSCINLLLIVCLYAFVCMFVSVQ